MFHFSAIISPTGDVEFENLGGRGPGRDITVLVPSKSLSQISEMFFKNDVRWLVPISNPEQEWRIEPSEFREFLVGAHGTAELPDGPFSVTHRFFGGGVLFTIAPQV